MPDPAYSQKRDPENEDGCSCLPTAVSDEKVRDDALEGYFPEFKLTFSFSGLLLLLIRIYKLCISPYLPRCCRFQPSCSAYAAESVLKHGVIKGVFLALFRLLRCQPFCKGGYDPVPEEFSWKEFFRKQKFWKGEWKKWDAGRVVQWKLCRRVMDLSGKK